LQIKRLQALLFKNIEKFYHQISQVGDINIAFAEKFLGGVKMTKNNDEATRKRKATANSRL
jgi:hypothetical protein